MGIKSLFKHLLLTTAVLSIYACGGGGESSNKTETIIEIQKQQSTNLVFADSKLTDCVQALIEREGYTLVEEIKQLTCSDEGIEDIEGIQNLSSLELLNLSNNQIRDITPISKLGKLKRLNLQGNNLQLLSPLTENQLLEQVDISNNNKAIICSEQTKLEQSIGAENIKANQPCAGTMQQAETATFGGEKLQNCIIETAKSLKIQYLEQIQQLKCVNYEIEDISGIEQLTNLRELDLTQNSIDNIAPLQNLSLLKKVLLGRNQITDIQPLTTSKYMQELRLDYNKLTDIQAVETLTALRQIHLTNNDIRDITPLQSLTGLLELRISNNRIIDIDSLANLSKLSSLWIQGNQIADLTPLQSLQHLEQLWLSNNWLTDLTPLQTQSKLKWLHLDGTEAADLQPLNKLTQLKWLQLDNTRVDDIIAIYPLAQLDWLHLKGNNTIPCSQLVHMEEILTPEKIDRPETCSKPQEQSGNPISTIEFQDEDLRDCVYEAARAQGMGITNAEELTALSCPGADITDITGLTQFPGIISIDLIGNDHISCTQLDDLRERYGYGYDEGDEYEYEAQYQIGNLTLPDACNSAPSISAQAELTAEINSQVTLDAQATDPNEDQLTYNWQQTNGDVVALTNANTQTPNFTAPDTEQTLTFQLTVTDEYGLSTTKTINILVTGAILGSKDNPFLVTSYKDLEKVGTGIDGWNLDSHYLQTVDIDATPSKTENRIPYTEDEYYGFEPIGNYEAPFTGGYDGGGFTIDGLTINRAEQNLVGLFSYAFNASFSDINLSSVDINGDSIIGGLAGMFAADDSTDINFKNIFVSGNLSGYNAFGGVFGQVTSNQGSSILIENIYANVNISTGDHDTFYVVGGVAGLLSGYNINIVKSSSTVRFSDSYLNDEVGGLVGRFSGYNLSVKDSNSEVNMIGFGEPENVGGLIGLFSGSNLAVSNSYSNGKLEGYGALAWSIGGLVGRLESDEGRIELISNYSSWDIDISNTDSSFIGGIVGWLSGNDIVLLDSYAENEITLDGGYHQVIGGLAGSIYGENIDLTNSYSIGNINISNEAGVQRVGGLVGDVGGGDINVSRVFASGNVTIIYTDDCFENGNDVCGYLVGGLIGQAGGKIDLNQAYATGNVSGDVLVGGLIGSQNGEITITNSYARGNVTGNSQVGGLVGQMAHSEGDKETPAAYSSITNSYSTGQVSLQNEELEPVDFGGLVGASTSELNTVTNSFWDIETGGQETSAGGEPKTSEELKTTTTFTNADWDFGQTWMILSEGYTYPRLAWNTIEVESWTDLSNMRNNMHANYVLTRDLLTTDADYAELAGPDANDGKGWEPVGIGEQPFMGTFNGGGFTIDGVQINRPDEVGVGLFGITVNSHYANIDLLNSYIEASGGVGGIVGSISSKNDNASIVSTTFSGEIHAENGTCGGLIGLMTGTHGVQIVDSSAVGLIFCNDRVAGGLAGTLLSSGQVSVIDSYSSVDIVNNSDGFNFGGGVGILDGGTVEIINAFANGSIEISGYAHYVGGFVGTLSGDLYARNSYANVSINADDGGFVGGFSGSAPSGYTGYGHDMSFFNVDISDCYATGDILINEGATKVGGMFGELIASGGIISDVYATGNITAPQASFVGGLIGLAQGPFQFSNNYAYGDITGKTYVGGLIGSLSGDVSNSYAEGDVVGEVYIGGMLGNLYSGNITNSYAHGYVGGTEQVGGLVGEFKQGQISSSYSSGLVEGTADFGGLIGVIEEGEITNSFWDTETSGQSTSAGGTGLPTAEMQTRSTFTDAGWDFADVWVMRDYPEFQWDSIAISDIEFIDTALRDCVLETAQSNGWTQSTQVTTLNCSNLEITDTTGLEQLTEITNLDLIGNNHISCNQLDELQNDIGEQGINRPDQCNLPPTISAEEQTVTTGAQVNLTAEVVDPNGDSLIYNWQQTGGQTVELTNAETAAPTFTAPEDGDQTLSFQLTVTDEYGLSTTKTINILVTGVILGSKDNPFLVTNYEDLEKVGTGIDGWNLDSHYLQTADIDATPSKTENRIPYTEDEYYGFEPIGNQETPFTGGYDGGGFTTDGLFINRSINGIGLFGVITGAATIHDVNLINVDIQATGNAIYVGSLVGEINSGEGGAIYNCTASGKVTSSNYHIGGLIGGFPSSYTSMNIYNCSTSCSVKTTRQSTVYAGGAFGYLQGENVRVERCYSVGDVIGDPSATTLGGFAGVIKDAVVSNSYASGDVLGGENATGGFVASLEEGVILNSYSSGSVSNDQYNTGGFVASSTGTITNSFWDTQTSGQETSAGGKGLTTTEMQTQSTFVDAEWDYESTWGYRTEDYPYLKWQNVIFVKSYEDLKKIGVLEGWPLDGNYIQIADIDASPSRSEDDGQGFFPIGENEPVSFTGSYDGSSYSIDGLYVNRPDTQFVGLFAYCSGCSISNVNIIGDSSITSRDRTGGLVGMSLGYYGIVTISNSTSNASVTSTGDNYGYAGGLIGEARYLHKISNSSSTGAVSGAGRVGGLIGLVSDSSQTIISKCYATGDVISDTYAGGLIGAFTRATLTDSYATGDISGSDLVGGLIGSVASAYVYNSYATGAVSAELDQIGGLIGQNSNTPINNSFWNIETSGQETSAGGIGLTTAEMQDQYTFESAGWDFDNIWRMDGYPKFKWDESSSVIEITSWTELQAISENLDDHYVLTRDLLTTDADYEEVAGSSANGGAGFIPIGNQTTKFTGAFDGGYFTIDGLNINRPETSFIGLFGRTSSATISSVIIDNAIITGQGYTGGMIGMAEGKGSNINNCSANVTVSASSAFMGGLIGHASLTVVDNSFSEGSVITSGMSDYAGGLIGHSNGGVISNSYSQSSVTGRINVGGLVGQITSSSTINNSYSTGLVTQVSGGVDVGGLVGSSSESTINNSFWDIETSGQEASAGGIGLTTAEMQNQSSFIEWDFDTIWEIAPESYPVLQ